jgi:hypothetical protein
MTATDAAYGTRAFGVVAVLDGHHPDALVLEHQMGRGGRRYVGPGEHLARGPRPALAEHSDLGIRAGEGDAGVDQQRG